MERKGETATRCEAKSGVCNECFGDKRKRLDGGAYAVWEGFGGGVVNPIVGIVGRCLDLLGVMGGAGDLLMSMYLTRFEGSGAHGLASAGLWVR